MKRLFWFKSLPRWREVQDKYEVDILFTGVAFQSFAVGIVTRRPRPAKP